MIITIAIIIKHGMQWAQKHTIRSWVAKWRLRLWDDAQFGRSYKTTVRGWVVYWTGSLRILMSVVKISWTFEFRRRGKFIHLLNECQMLNTKSAGVDTWSDLFAVTCLICSKALLVSKSVSYSSMTYCYPQFQDLKVSGASVAQPCEFSRPPCFFFVDCMKLKSIAEILLRNIIFTSHL